MKVGGGTEEEGGGETDDLGGSEEEEGGGEGEDRAGRACSDEAVGSTGVTKEKTAADEGMLGGAPSTPEGFVLGEAATGEFGVAPAAKA